LLLGRLQAQDYRLALERSRDSKDTTFISPLSPQNHQRFLKVLQLTAGVPLSECTFVLTQLFPWSWNR
jgi:hypothetical protein